LTATPRDQHGLAKGADLHFGQHSRFDRPALCARNRAERLIKRFKQVRAIATRYDKLAVRYHAALVIGSILPWW
jgi:hypothetical protein